MVKTVQKNKEVLGMKFSQKTEKKSSDANFSRGFHFSKNVF